MSILCLVLQFVIFQFSFHGLFLIKAGVLLAYTALDLAVSILGLSIFQLTFHVTQETLFAPGTTIRIIYLIVTNSFECILLLIGYKFVHLRKQLTCHQFIIFFLFILNDAFSMFLCYLVLLSAETIYIKLICIFITNLSYLSSEKHYVIVHYQRKTVSVREKLDYYDHLLSPHFFVRIGKSFLINLFYVDRLLPRDILLKTGEQFPISRNYIEDVRGKYMDYIRAIS